MSSCFVCCVVFFVPQMYAMSHYTVVCLSSPAHVVSSRRFAFALRFSYCVSIRSIAFACRLCAVVRGSSPHHRFSFLLSSVLCLCICAPCFAFAFLCLFFTSRSFAFALMMLIDALPVETTFAAVSPLAEAFHLAIVKTVAQYRPER